VNRRSRAAPSLTLSGEIEQLWQAVDRLDRAPTVDPIRAPLRWVVVAHPGGTRTVSLVNDETGGTLVVFGPA